MWETPHVCLNFYESVLYVATALGWVSHVWQQTAGELHLVVPGLLQEPRPEEERCPPARAPLFLKNLEALYRVSHLSAKDL